VPAPDLAVVWLLDGVAVAGAVGASYTPAPADDRKALAARVTATNAAGAASATTVALAVVQVAPQAVAALDDVEVGQGGAPVVLEAAPAFAGADLRFSVAGGGAAIVAATGRLCLPVAAPIEAAVTVTATNSGGSASLGFRLRVSAPVILPPVLIAVPVLAGAGRIGQPVTLEGGGWGGTAPVVTRQWLRDGAAIPGATGTSYTPVAADDRTALCCRITATNPAGQAETLTAALSITYVAPVAKGLLEEEILDLAPGFEVVAAGADFVGEGLSFAVTGAGATIDAAGFVHIPTDRALQATVTVTAMNSGGSASSCFAVTVEAEDVPFAREIEDVEILESVWRPAGQGPWFSPLVRLGSATSARISRIERPADSASIRSRMTRSALRAAPLQCAARLATI
jgi:hypothetical protein